MIPGMRPGATMRNRRHGWRRERLRREKEKGCAQRKPLAGMAGGFSLSVGFLAAAYSSQGMRSSSLAVYFFDRSTFTFQPSGAEMTEDFVSRRGPVIWGRATW